MNFGGQLPSYEPAMGNDSNSGASSSMLQLRDFLRREWRLIVLATGLSIILGATYVATHRLSILRTLIC
jgi:polysaccharide biosynthesis transport protein